DVVVAEAEEQALDRPAQCLCRWSHPLDDALRLTTHGGPRLRRITHLNEVLRHATSLTCAPQCKALRRVSRQPAQLGGSGVTNGTCSDLAAFFLACRGNESTTARGTSSC